MPSLSLSWRAVAAAAVAGGLALGPLAPVAGAAEAAEAARGARGAAAVGLALQSPDDGGLSTQTRAVYVVDPEAGVTRVSVDLTLTNQVEDVNEGGVIRQTYFSQISVPVLREATNFGVIETGDGHSLVVQEEPVPDNPWVEFATIELDPRVFHGDGPRSFRLTYDLPNQAARAETLSRANDAFVSLPVFTDGDPGQTSVEVRIPDRYDVQVVGGDLAREESDGQIVLSADAIADPEAFIPVVVAGDDAHLVERTVDLDGVAVSARAWPNDADWADFVIGTLGDAFPVLTDLIGQPWPADDELDVIETSAPYAYGYAGWYEEVGNAISIGDQLDPLVIVHEVSHAWFNSDLFGDRWVNEGFAEEYAAQTLDRLGQAYQPLAPPDPSSAAAITLNDWGNPSILDEQSAANEQYGYAASWYVIDQIAAEIGMDQLREVIDASAHDEIAYLGDPGPEDGAEVTDWRRLLDLLEEWGGSRQAASLFQRYVVTQDQQAQLTARTTARQAYAALAGRSNDWSPPLALRRLMADWDFGRVDATIAEADAVLARRTEIERVLRGTAVDRIGLEDTYESAPDLADVVTAADATLEAAEAYRDAAERYDHSPGILGSIGLWWSGTDDRLADARTGLEEGNPGGSQQASATVQQRLDDATRNGALRLAGGVAAVGATGALGALRLRRRRQVAPIRITVRSRRHWPLHMPPRPEPPSLSPLEPPPSPPSSVPPLRPVGSPVEGLTPPARAPQRAPTSRID